MSPVANPTRILGSPTFGRNLCGFDYEVAPSVPSMKSAVLDNLLQGRASPQSGSSCPARAANALKRNASNPPQSPRYGGAPCELAVLNPAQMDASLAQQLAHSGTKQREPNLRIGSSYVNEIVVK